MLLSVFVITYEVWASLFSCVNFLYKWYVIQTLALDSPLHSWNLLVFHCLLHLSLLVPYLWEMPLVKQAAATKDKHLKRLQTDLSEAAPSSVVKNHLITRSKEDKREQYSWHASIKSLSPLINTKYSWTGIPTSSVWGWRSAEPALFQHGY